MIIDGSGQYVYGVLFGFLATLTVFACFVVLVENYHRLYDVLCRLKLPSLSDTRKEAKARYQRALQEYSMNCMGRPLEDLHVSIQFPRVHWVKRKLQASLCLLELLWASSKCSGLGSATWCNLLPTCISEAHSSEDHQGVPRKRGR